jgi:hypothetical protein
MTKWKRPKPKGEQRGRPSLFFIIAMALGVLLLIWLFGQAVTRPMKPAKRGGLEVVPFACSMDAPQSECLEDVES